jgi:cytochrome P450 family 110
MPVAALPAPEKATALQLWQYLRNPQTFTANLRARHGDLASVRFLSSDYVMILTPQGAQQVFAQTPDNYEAFWHEAFAGMNGEGSLWVLAGAAHRRERRLFAPATDASHFRAYGDVIRDIAHRHFRKWEPGGTVKAFETTKAIALDVIMRLVFGVVDQPLMDEGRAIIDKLHATPHPLIVFFPKLQRSWFPLFRRYLRAKAAMHEWARRLMALRRARGKSGDDVLSRLMTAYDEHGGPYVELHICNELISILSAGHVTTGVALAWALYELGRHPEAMAKLRTELERAGPDPETGLILSLPYLSAVCDEAIRLHPILAECARVPIAPVEILGYAIPAGRALVISIVGIHHDGATYPDPNCFRPERFLERTYSKTEFMPYGGGHRRCLGAGLAKYTLRIALAEAVMNWEFETAAVDRDTRYDLAMGPKYGVPLRILRPRQRSLRADAILQAVKKSRPVEAAIGG